MPFGSVPFILCLAGYICRDEFLVESFDDFFGKFLRRELAANIGGACFLRNEPTNGQAQGVPQVITVDVIEEHAKCQECGCWIGNIFACDIRGSATRWIEHCQRDIHLLIESKIPAGSRAHAADQSTSPLVSG